MRLICLFIIAVLLSQPLVVVAQQGKPNVLVIFVDDLGYGDIGIHGGKDVATPHIDALAAAGVRCTNGYVSAPYCSPSRAGMITGRAQTRFGHEFNPHVGEEKTLGLPLNQRTIADYMKSAGYTTALFGKWHLGFSEAHHPLERGFDEFQGFLVGAHNFTLSTEAKAKFGSAHSSNMIYRGRELQKLNGYTTDLFTDNAMAFMDRHSAKPWFIYLSYNAVHTPLEVMDKHRARIPDRITDPARIGYLSLLIGLDDAVGRLVAHLKKSGTDRNTLIFFVGDNGGSGRKPFFAYNTGMNTPLRGDKGQMLEGGIRVPFLITWPGKLPAGQVYGHPVTALDILPTACALAGIKTDPAIEGVNLMPHLTGQTEGAPHQALYWRFGPQKAMRQGNWKLVDWRDFEKKEQSGWELYDLDKDIGETNNLAATHPDRTAQMVQAWEKWNQHNVAPIWRGTPNEDPSSPPRSNTKPKTKEAE